MSYLEDYRASHRNRANQICHFVGIPTIVASFPVALWRWKVGLGLFICGWILQFVGHAFEGKPPALFRDPRHLLTGPIWLWNKFTKKSFSKQS